MHQTVVVNVTDDAEHLPLLGHAGRHKRTTTGQLRTGSTSMNGRAMYSSKCLRTYRRWLRTNSSLLRINPSTAEVLEDPEITDIQLDEEDVVPRHFVDEGQTALGLPTNEQQVRIVDTRRIAPCLSKARRGLVRLTQSRTY